MTKTLEDFLKWADANYRGFGGGDTIVNLLIAPPAVYGCLKFFGALLDWRLEAALAWALVPGLLLLVVAIAEYRADKRDGQ